MYVQTVQSRAVWPVSEAEVKEYLGLPDSYSTPLLAAYIEAATEAVERYSGRATTRRQIDLWSPLPPFGEAVAIPQPPLVSLDEAVLVNSQNVETELTEDQYLLETGGRVAKFYLNSVAPKQTAIVGSGYRLRLRCTVGYETAADVPADLRLAVLRTVARSWEAKSSVAIPDISPLEDADLWRSWQRA